MRNFIQLWTWSPAKVASAKFLCISVCISCLRWNSKHFNENNCDLWYKFSERDYCIFDFFRVFNYIHCFSEETLILVWILIFNLILRLPLPYGEPLLNHRTIFITQNTVIFHIVTSLNVLLSQSTFFRYHAFQFWSIPTIFRNDRFEPLFTVQFQTEITSQQLQNSFKVPGARNRPRQYLIGNVNEVLVAYSYVSNALDLPSTNLVPLIAQALLYDFLSFVSLQGKHTNDHGRVFLVDKGD